MKQTQPHLRYSRRSLEKALVACLATLALAALASTAKSQVIYSENFDVGTTDGQSLTASPLNWTNTYASGGGTDDVTISSSTGFGPSLAVDGSTATAQSQQVYSHGFSAPSTAINFTADVIATTEGSNSWIGLADAATGLTDTAYFISKLDGSNLDWYFDASGLGGSKELVGSFAGGTSLQVGIELNYATNTVSGFITDGVTTDTVSSMALTSALVADVNGVTIELDHRSTDPVVGAGGDFDVDNIVVTTAPEPSIAMLSLAGLAGMIWFVRRTRRASLV